MLTFFEIQTLEDWHVPYFHAIDSSTEKDHGPNVNNRHYLFLLFVAFIFMTSFFVLNIIITILITSYQNESTF